MRLAEPRSYPFLSYIAVECLDGSFAFYRFWNGRLEHNEGECSEWSEVPAEKVFQHLLLRTPVGIRLEGVFAVKSLEWPESVFRLN
jgi:hypothetical protein